MHFYYVVLRALSHIFHSPIHTLTRTKLSCSVLFSANPAITIKLLQLRFLLLNDKCKFWSALVFIADKDWKINVPRNIIAESGRNVTIHCNFSYPQKHHTRDVEVYWKSSVESDKSNCSEGDVDRRAFVFHTNEACVLGKYKQKTILLGNKYQGNCTLRIINIESSDQNLYVRIYVGKEKYSYRKGYVTISLNGQNFIYLNFFF